MGVHTGEPYWNNTKLNIHTKGLLKQKKRKKNNNQNSSFKKTRKDTCKTMKHKHDIARNTDTIFEKTVNPRSKCYLQYTETACYFYNY
jgi:hypothetical protein